MTVGDAQSGPQLEPSIGSDTRLSLGIEILPDEVLLKIFMALAIPFSSEKRSRSWYRFSQVCRRWRILALNCPLLWAKPDWSYGAAAAEEMIRRSGDTPLFVQCNSSGNSRSAFYAFSRAIAERHRVYGLQISIDPFAVEASSRAPFPPMSLFFNLESLDMTFTRWDQLIQRTIVLSFTGESKLRDLSLHNCLFNLENAKFPNLVSLWLASRPFLSRDSSSSTLTAVSLTNLISDAPNLESLRCESAIRAVEGTQGVQKPVFQHQGLRKLSFSTESVVACMQVFRALEFPSLREVHIAVSLTPRERASESVHVAEMLRSLQPIYCRLPYPSVIFEHVRYGEDNATIQWGDSNNRGSRRQEYKAYLSSEGLCHSLGFVPFLGPHVRKLDMFYFSKRLLSANVWLQLFRRLPQLEVICVPDHALNDLLELLYEKPLPDGHFSFGLNLSSIVVHVGASQAPHTVEWKPEWTECLLKREADMGRPLRKLVFSSTKKLSIPEELEKLASRVVAWGPN